VISIQQPELYASYLSPDGMWRMDITIYSCVKVGEGMDELAYEKLTLIDLASGEELLADEQLQNCGGVGAYGFAGRFWSPNSRYFYYTNAQQGFPDGCGYWDAPLSRFDIASLENEYLGAGTLSPDGSKLATWDGGKQALVIWDVDYGELSRFTPVSDILDMGPVVWSPDSRSLVYIQVESWCPVSGKSLLAKVDASGYTQSLVLESDDPTFAGAEWDDMDILSLFDQDGKAWRFNLLTGELAPVP
jgi:WD40 repeat protein